MKVTITNQAYLNLERSLSFLKEKSDYTQPSIKKLREKLLFQALVLSDNPRIGQFEDELQYLNQDHRRVIEGHFKIIYFIKDDEIYVTDFFDSRRNPIYMKG